MHAHAHTCTFIPCISIHTPEIKGVTDTVNNKLQTIERLETGQHISKHMTDERGRITNQ